jgi:hypothetical protein
MTKITDQLQLIAGLETKRDADLAALCSGDFFSEPPQFPKTLISSLITQTPNTISLGSIDGLQAAIGGVEGTGAAKISGVQDKLDEFIVLKQTALKAAQEVVDKAKTSLADFEADEKAQQKSRTKTLTLGMTREEVEGTLSTARDARNKIRDEISAMQAAKAQLQSQASGIETEYEKSAKVEQEKLTTLEKEGAKALEAFQQKLFKQIIEQATLAKVNEKLGVEGKSTAEIAKAITGKVGGLEELRASLTEAQTSELDGTISALKDGNVAGSEIDTAALFAEVDREAEKSVQGVFNNPNYKLIDANLKEMCSQPQYKHLEATVELVKGDAGLEWKVKSGVDGVADTVGRLQQDLNTQLKVNPKLKAANEAFVGLVDGQVEEAQKSPTLWDKFINFINQIKQKLGLDVKLENKQEISSKQDRAAKRSVGKFTKDVLQKAGSSRGVGM